jgi:hypothetical protein
LTAKKSEIFLFEWLSTFKYLFSEKTRQLLFTGARKQIDEVVIDANDNSPSIPNQNMTGQMCLDKTGQIVLPCETSVELPSGTSSEQDDEMDVDAILVDNHSNKKISDFFAVKS